MPGRTRGGRAVVPVAQRIQELILSGDFVGGDRLIEEDLAARLAVSRTPIREALHALAAQGLITRGSRTWTVSKLDVRDFREIYEIRGALECAASRLAAVRRSSADVQAIDEANRASRSVLGGSAADFTRVSEQVHELIVQAANNRRLLQEMQKSRLLYFVRPLAALYTSEELEESIAEHEAVARAIADQNPGAADAAMGHHIERALEILIRKLAWLT